MSFPTVGDLFHDRYRLDEVLGRGGFSTVFAAVDTVSARRVAIKILRPDSGGYPADVESRFTREVRVVANLRDPHTVTMYDFGTSAQGLLFMVFEHVPGRDLSELLASHGKLDAAAVTRVLRQVLQSLGEAHSAGLLHRDIKPENIRVYEYGGDPLRVKLLDFGIARPSAAEGPQITRPGEIVGTPAYMSPEQLLEQRLTPASDLYSVALVTMEMLVGVAASGNNWGDQVHRLKSGFAFSLRAPEGVPQELWDIVIRMAAREPGDRYQSAGDVLRDLDQVSSLQATPAAPPIAAPPPRESTAGTSHERRPIVRPVRPTHTVLRGYRRAVMLAAIAGCLTVVGVASYTLIRADAPATPVRAAPARPDALLRTAQPALAPPVVVDTPDLAPLTVDAGPPSTTASAGCGAAVEGYGLIQLRSISGLQGRTWDVFLPPSYRPNVPHPTIIVFHDAGVPAVQYIRDAQIDQLAERVGAVLLLPNDEMTIDGTGFFGRVWEDADDLDKVHTLWEIAQDQLCLDTSRVYAFGQAAGGYAVERLPCEFPITAIATNAHIKVPHDPYCEPKQPVPYILFVGNKDQFVPIDGGPNCAIPTLTVVEKLSWDETAKRWRKNNHTAKTGRTVTRTADGVCTEWSGDAPFTMCRLEGGRELPRTPPRRWDFRGCSGVPTRFPVLETMWEFFEAAPPRELASP